MQFVTERKKAGSYFNSDVPLELGPSNYNFEIVVVYHSIGKNGWSMFVVNGRHQNPE